MIQGVTSSVIPNIAYYSQVAEASMYLSNVMSEAMLLKSKLGSVPIMELGTSKTLNTLA